MSSTIKMSGEARAGLLAHLNALLGDVIGALENPDDELQALASRAGRNLERLGAAMSTASGIDGMITSRLRTYRGTHLGCALLGVLANSKTIDETIVGAREIVTRIEGARSQESAEQTQREKVERRVKLEADAEAMQPHAIVLEAEKDGGKLWINADGILVSTGRVHPRALEIVKLRRGDVINFLAERDRQVAV
ncbi:MAG TPA: hypothetical protein VNF29_05020 [Candidatus Binataceae bacterium]|nr:hypothetical protein [Candidatus Binataceae bacterium]HVA80265.1 hypothetical protein [Candidatus Binataceae bacterium]